MFIRFGTGLLTLCLTTIAAAQTGTFFDRNDANDVRVMTYNIKWDSIFADTDPCNDAWRDCSSGDKFRRLIKAIDPDIALIQEIGGCHTGQDVADIFDQELPLGGGQTWYSAKGNDCVTVSRYPLSMVRANPIPAGYTFTGSIMALVDLPDGTYNKDVYTINQHWKCCSNSGDQAKRQQQADAVANWIRDIKSPGGNIDLPFGTPIVIGGDLNVVQTPEPLTTIITGDIQNEGTYGSDFNPDWDGTSNTDAHPYHNVTLQFDWTAISPAVRIDIFVYSDSAADEGNKFVIDTRAMSSADLTATGLQSKDVVTCDPFGVDHLPVVWDFNLGSPDCNENAVDDDQDILSGTSQDCNSNGLPDECEIDENSSAPGGPFFCESDCDPDCNDNGIPDWCDANGGGSADVDGDDVPDECEADCNNNGFPDDYDIQQGTSQDCNNNTVPDECDITLGTSQDVLPVGGDGIPDECQSDCNGNQIPDGDDISSMTSEDCNLDGVPDECEIDQASQAPGGPFYCTFDCDPDCNDNGIPDDCDIDDGTSQDCNNNDVPDECDIGLGTSEDCDTNSIPDECQADGDSDGVIDACDNCPADSNPGQADLDSDQIGDVCDPDRDGDGVANGSDNCPDDNNPNQEDGDGDGVGDPCDLCPGTPPATQVDPDGCPYYASSDFDTDGDVDLVDFGHLQECYTEQFGSPTPDCLDADLDGNNSVNQADFTLFQNCFSGPNVTPVVGCDN